MPKKLPGMAQAYGFCCTYAFLRTLTGRASVEAQALGLDKSTILYWRRKIGDGTCTCTSAPTCPRRQGKPPPTGESQE